MDHERQKKLSKKRAKKKLVKSKKKIERPKVRAPISSLTRGSKSKPKRRPLDWDATLAAGPTRDEEAQILTRMQTSSVPRNPDRLPDPRKLIEQAVANDLDTSVFTQETFETAKNVIDWCRNPKFLGTKIDLFARQIQVMSHFFSDICYQCSDIDFIYQVPVDASVGECLDRFALLEHGVCPQCKRNRMETIQEWQRDYRFGDFNPHLEDRVRASMRPVPPNEFVGVWGQRSGKSFMVSTFAWTYILHRYLAVPSLAKYFDQPDNVVFEASFVAPTLNQVKKYLWLPFRHAYFDSPWFREIREYTIAEGKRVGIPLYKSEETFIVFFNKRIAIHMLAANSSTLRGGTRFFSAIDELGWFNTKAGTNSRVGVRDGKEVFQSLSNSLRTFRTQADEYRRGRLKDYNSLDGYMFNISSPSSIADPIMERGAQAANSNRIYYTHYPTWDVNPREKEYLICEEFAGDPVRLQRDFYAIPPKATAPFIEDDSVLPQLIYKDEDVKLFDVDLKVHQDMSGHNYLRPSPTHIRADPHTPRVLAVDNGEVKNSFAIVIGRYYPEHDGVLFEECVEVAPYQDHSVDLAWCYDHFILPLVKSFNFLFVVYDRWNSAHAVHDLRTNYSVDAVRYTLRWKDFDRFRNDLYGSKIWFSKPETTVEEVLRQANIGMRSQWPRTHLQAQIVTVNQFGKNVYKPDQGNDDLFRPAVLCHQTVQANIKEYRSKTRLVNYTGNPEAVGFFSSRDGTRATAGTGQRRRTGSTRRRSFYSGGSTPNSGNPRGPGGFSGM